MKLIYIHCVIVDSEHFSSYNLNYNHNVVVWRGTVGTEKLRIGELADITSVTKRTIDHYTNLGLLKAERSTSNYRYYDHSAIDRLHLIEQYKKDGMSLDEIKKMILEKDAEEIDVLELRLKIKGLEKDVSEILAHLDKNDLKNHDYVKNNVSRESMSLIQTLLLLLN